jgi:hypothetical protein
MYWLVRKILARTVWETGVVKHKTIKDSLREKAIVLQTTVRRVSLSLCKSFSSMLIRGFNY